MYTALDGNGEARDGLGPEEEEAADKAEAFSKESWGQVAGLDSGGLLDAGS